MDGSVASARAGSGCWPGGLSGTRSTPAKSSPAAEALPLSPCRRRRIAGVQGMHHGASGQTDDESARDPIVRGIRFVGVMSSSLREGSWSAHGTARSQIGASGHRYPQRGTSTTTARRRWPGGCYIAFVERPFLCEPDWRRACRNSLQLGRDAPLHDLLAQLPAPYQGLCSLSCPAWRRSSPG